MKFLADMGISSQTVFALKNLGHDAIHLHEQALDRLPDPEIIKKALLENRVLLVHDLDFGELLSYSKAKLPSVITFRLRNMKPNNVNRYLEKIISMYEEQLKRGCIISVTDGQIRLRELPI